MKFLNKSFLILVFVGIFLTVLWAVLANTESKFIAVLQLWIMSTFTVVLIFSAINAESRYQIYQDQLLLDKVKELKEKVDCRLDELNGELHLLLKKTKRSD